MTKHLTQERLEEINAAVEEFGQLGGPAALELLAALEEAQQEAAEEKKWRDVEHEVAAVYHRELIEAQQTIARQQAKIIVLERDNEMLETIANRQEGE